MRTLIKRLHSTEDKNAAIALLSQTKSFLDRLASKGVIPANKASNYKSHLEKHVQALS
jgi:ribosomal protein S20